MMSRTQWITLRAAVIYALIASAWIFFSDWFVETQFTDVHSLTVVQTIKGWFFIAANSVALYILLRHVFSVRGRIEAVQEEGRRWLQQAVQAGNVGLFDWDRRTNRVNYSLEWKRQIGYSDDEVADGYNEWRDRLHPDDRDRVISIVQSYLENPWPDYQLEFRLRHKDGSYRWILARAALEFDSWGKPIRMLGSHLDITERKRAEETLQEAEARLRLALRAGDIGTWDWDIETGRIVLSRDHEEIWGMVPGTFNGTFEEFEARLHPEDREGLRHAMAQAIAERRTYRHEFRIVWPDGSVHWIAGQSEPFFDDAGTLVRIVGTVKDITGRKLTLAMLQCQKQVLELITQGAPLHETLEVLLRFVEAEYSEMLCSILLLDADGVSLRRGVAPSLPEDYLQAILAVGDRPGPGDTAALRRETVVVEDIATDPSWQDYRALALSHGLRACWSTPIWDAQRRLLGIFAIYFRTPGRPTKRHMQFIDMASHTAAITISKEREQEALQENQRTLSTLMSNLPGMAYRCRNDKDWTMEFISEGCYALTGYHPSDLVGNRVVSYGRHLIHPDDQESVWNDVQVALRERRPFQLVYRLIAADKKERWVWEQGRGILSPSGDLLALEGFVADITERKVQQDKIARLTRIYAVLSGINAAIIRIHNRDELFQEVCRIAITEGTFRMAWIGTIDPTTLEATVVARAEDKEEIAQHGKATAFPAMPGNDPLIRVAAREGRAAICNDIATQPSLGSLRNDLLDMGYRSNAVFPLIVGSRVVAVLVLFAEEAGFFDADELRLLNELAGDIAFGLQYIEKEEALNYLAYHDALTNLPNRHLLVDRLTQAITHARRAGGRPLALLFLDLDGFKHINDSFGHAFGDALLRMVAARLQQTLRDGDTVARQGGDEFIVLLTGLERPEDAGMVAAKLLKELARPFLLSGRELHIRGSIGACLYPENGEDIEALLKNADTALYRVKEEGGNGFRYYAQDMGVRAMERMELEAALRHALERQEFMLYYQPKADLKTGRIIGAEALIRWQPPQGEIVLPQKFIPVAEEVGLIGPIGEWVLRTACAQMKEWWDAGLPRLTVSINVSARQFRHELLGKQIAGACRQAGLEPQYLELELTESTVMRHIEESILTLKELNALGLPLTIDDFGTGYSSLEHLKRFPFDRIKIDQSFVRDIGYDADDEAIVRSMISLGHSLGLKVVAEGVETRKQADILRDNGCDEMQGFLFSHPLPVAEFVAFLKKGVVLGGAAKKRQPGKKSKVPRGNPMAEGRRRVRN